MWDRRSVRFLLFPWVLPVSHSLCICSLHWVLLFVAQSIVDSLFRHSTEETSEAVTAFECGLIPCDSFSFTAHQHASNSGPQRDTFISFKG